MKVKVIRYAYTYQGNLVGYSERANVKFAGEINPKGTEWYTPETPVERCPQGDEIETPYGVKTRWEIDLEDQEALQSQKIQDLYAWVENHNSRS